MLDSTLYKKSPEKKIVCLFGLQLYKAIKQKNKKRVFLFGLPLYSVKKEGFKTTRRILFIRYSRTDKIGMLKKELDIIQEKVEKHCKENKKHLDNISMSIEKIRYDSSNVSTIRKSSSEAVWGISFHDVTSDSGWLKNKSFAAGRWALGYPALYALYRILNEARPKHILELGLGQSTRMIGQYAAAFDSVEHSVVEHDPEWIAFFQRDFALSEQSHVVQLDREMMPYKEAVAVRTFAGFAEAFSGRKFDFICIDAPLGGDMKQYARIDVLKLLPACLEDDFIIMLDDTNRSGETNTLREMKAVLDQAGIKYHVGHYEGDKKTSLICSTSRKFFASM